MQLAGRSYNGGNYKFGFNGQMKDDEIYGTGNAYTAEFWEYDPRIGRRWNPEVKAAKFPSWSVYSVLGDNPIRNIDRNGDDWWVLNDGSLLNVPNTSVLPESMNESNAVRIGNDNYFGKGVGVSNSYTIMNAAQSQAFAQSNGFEIVPTQTLVSEDISTMSISTGKKSVDYTYGKKITINEKYGVVPIGSAAENTKSRQLDWEPKSSVLENVLGLKRTISIHRENYVYKPQTTWDKIGNGIKQIFSFISKTMGKHEDIVEKTYESGNSYTNDNGNDSLNKYIEK
jgi:hypothetical protein